MRSLMEAPQKIDQTNPIKKKAYTAWWRWTFKLCKIFFPVRLILRIRYNSWLEIANWFKRIRVSLLAYGEQNR